MPGRSKFPSTGLRPNAGSPSNANEKIFSEATLGYDGTKFKIAPTVVRFQFNTEVMDITGEFSGNLTGTVVTETKMKTMSYVKGQVLIKGDVPSAQAIGLVNLETTEYIDVAFLLGVGADELTSAAAANYNRLYIRVVPESVVIDWNLEKPTVQITLSGRVSEKHTGKSHPIEEAQNTL